MNEPAAPTPVIWDDIGQLIVWGIGIIMIIALIYFMKLIIGSAVSDDDEEDEKKN